jgi:CRP-like cAMP-binding protein
MSQQIRPGEQVVVSHEDLAKMIGSLRQSVTSILKGREREVWLLQSYGGIQILQPDKLSAFFRE